MKCDEIKELCDKFDKAVLKREDDLKKAIDIHECLEMVTAVISYYQLYWSIRAGLSQKVSNRNLVIVSDEHIDCHIKLGHVEVLGKLSVR